MFSVERIQAGLNTEFLGREVKYLDITSSTNDDAWDCFQNQNPEGSLIITNHQYQGRGRRKSKWSSTKGKSLTFSFMLRPEMDLEKLSLLPLLTGVSIIKGIYSMTNILCGLKWPNDIMISREKMGGILIESRIMDKKVGVVIGIGLNINELEADIPNALQGHATSLQIDSGEEFSLELILSSILNEFENLYLNNWHDIIPQWQEFCIHNNDKVTFHINEKLHSGIFLGITDSGHAKIQVNGKMEKFSAGMVTL